MRKLTHEEQVEAIRKVNPNITVLGHIEGNDAKTLWRWDICGWEWFWYSHEIVDFLENYC